MANVTKPLALDETLQGTNSALAALGKDTTLQAIATALANIGINTVGNLATLVTTDKSSLVNAINEVAGDCADKADKVESPTEGNLAGLDDEGNLIDAGWSADKTTTSASGNPLSISGLKSDQLAIDPIITFEPIQAGSGTPSPENVRAISGYDKVEALSCGKNIFDADAAFNVSGWTKSASGVYSGSLSAVILPFRAYSQALKFKATTQYTLKFKAKVDDVSSTRNVRFVFVYDDGSTQRTAYINTTTETEYSLVSQSGKNISYIDIAYTNATGCNLFVSDIQLEEGSSATTYEPYKSATSISESLGQTVYWGEWDLRSGKFKVIGQYVDLSELSWVLYNDNIYQSSDLQTLKKGGRINIISDRYEVVNVNSVANLGSNQMCGNITTGVIYVGSTTPTGYAVYELATPFTIQLTPHELALLKTYAYLSTNGSNIQLSYHNGEMASLGDVSQLGETVNELGEYLQRDATIGDMVDLTSYTAANNRYIFPSDGYIFINGRNNTSGYIRVYVYGKSSSTVNAGIGMNITAIQSIQSLFVKKGMSCYVSTELSASSIIVGFNPIK